MFGANLEIAAKSLAASVDVVVLISVRSRRDGELRLYLP